jgi:branched-chain amino acid transport system substrate-binding protein
MLQEARMGQYKRMFLALLTTIGLTACQSGPPPFECTDAIGCVTIGPDEPIKIGAIQTLSGEVSPLGIDQVRAIELIMADRDNQLLGHPLQLQSEDSLCSGEGGTTAALKIVADPQIIGIIGTTCSGEAVTAAKVMSEAGLVMISGSNTSPSLTSIAGEPGPNWQPGYFRTAHNDAVQSRVAATLPLENSALEKRPPSTMATPTLKV